MENKFPGMWQRWFLNQCVAVGWPSKSGYKLSVKSNRAGWNRARRAIQEIKPGDVVVVSLRGNKVGRIGQVTGTAIEDDQWDPLVPRSKKSPYGDMGRRIFVRWDLKAGPDDRELIIKLPERVRFNAGELRRTISQIRSISVTRLKKTLSDPSNWIGLLDRFGNEKALSDYIAAYPHRLEDGFLAYPNEKVREKVFTDRSRLDILLQDREGHPVIVECKQGQPEVRDLAQLRHYLKLLKSETGAKSRGIFIHGGAQKLRQGVARFFQEETTH